MLILTCSLSTISTVYRLNSPSKNSTLFEHVDVSIFARAFFSVPSITNCIENI